MISEIGRVDPTEVAERRDFGCTAMEGMGAGGRAGDRHEPRAVGGVCGQREGVRKEWGRVCQGVALSRIAPGLSCSRAPAL